VLSGVQSGEDSFAGTGVSLAEEVDHQWAAVVNDFSVNWNDATADVQREPEGGIEELTAIDLPAVLTIQTVINESRYAKSGEFDGPGVNPSTYSRSLTLTSSSRLPRVRSR